MQGYIHSYETFGTVDGPGIRFVVFTQGCPMRCLYCHNPDTWHLKEGKVKEVQEVLKEIKKYKAFLKDGGVTISGGEPLQQIEFVTALAKACKEEGLHVALDTSGVYFSHKEAWYAKYEELMKYIDLVLLDIKHIDSKQHQVLTSHKNEAVIAMAKDLSKRNKPVWVRYVVVPGYSDNRQDIHALKDFLSHFSNVERVEVLPYHKMGTKKYEELKMVYPIPDVEPPSKEDLKEIREILKIK